MTDPESERETLIAAGVQLWHQGTHPTLRAAMVHTGISRKTAYNIFGQTQRGLEDEYQHQLASASIAATSIGQVIEGLLTPTTTSATNEELTRYLAETIQMASTAIEAWGHSTAGRAYIEALTSAHVGVTNTLETLQATLTEATARVIGDGLHAFGLIPAGGQTTTQISAAVIATITEHLTSPPAAIAVTTNARTWTPLGFALAQHVATSATAYADPSAQPTSLIEVG